MTPGDDPSLVRTQNLLLKNRLAEHGQKMAALNQEIARKRAERAGVEASIRKLQATLPLLEKRLNMKEELVKDAYVSEMAVIDSRLEVANQKNDLAWLRAKRSETIAAESAAVKSRTQADAEFRYRTLMNWRRPRTIRYGSPGTRQGGAEKAAAVADGAPATGSFSSWPSIRSAASSRRHSPC